MDDKLDIKDTGGITSDTNPEHTQTETADESLAEATASAAGAETGYSHTEAAYESLAEDTASAAGTETGYSHTEAGDESSAADNENSKENVSPYFSGGKESMYRQFADEEDFVPDYSKIKMPRKRNFLLRLAVWITVVLLASAAVLVCFKFFNKAQPEEKKSNDRIPYNTNSDVSYAAEASIQDAPDVSADPDGPQISASEEKTDIDKNEANSAFNKASPSIVCITSYKTGSDVTLSKIGDGSGIVITEDGYIATNSHVVSDSVSTGVMVTLNDGTQYLGTIIGVDPKTDLAVLKIDAKGLSKAEFADSDDLYVGQDVYAIGNPGGAAFSNSLTKGTVSAVNRILNSKAYVKFIQTDAAINPGNSGGALVNSEGMVVGMSSSKFVATDYEGIGFAIPSNTVIDIINTLIRYGYIKDRGTIGITGITCNLYESKLKNVPQGMVITKINRNSPLAKTTVKEQDIITAINGVTIKSSNEFIGELSKYKPGDTVTLTMFRAASDGNPKSFTFDIDVVLIEDNSN